MPDAGPSNRPGVTRATEAPMTGAAAQPRTADTARVDLTPPRRVSTPPAHFSNPLDNMIVVASQLVALPVTGKSPPAVEARKAVELL